jgi:hypothetical protein
VTRMRRVETLPWKPVDRKPAPRGPSRARATAVAVVVLLLCGACGEEPAPAPPQGPFPLPAVSGEDTLRDRFSLHAGAACARAYAETASLQAALLRLQRAVRRRPPARKPQARRRASKVIERIESRSLEFLRRFEAIPLPSPPRRRQDASRLLESTGELVRLQLVILDVVSAVLGESPRESRAQRARLPALHRRLRPKLREQQKLAHRLDIPECVSS